jgi:hypothetical protein
MHDDFYSAWVHGFSIGPGRDASLMKRRPVAVRDGAAFEFPPPQTF